MGPGTHISDKMHRGVQPLNKADFLAMLHDIEYMQNKSAIQSDIRAIKNANYDIPGIIMKAGLGSRILLSSIAPNLARFDAIKNPQLANHLLYKLKNDSKYKPLWSYYSVDPNEYSYEAK